MRDRSTSHSSTCSRRIRWSKRSNGPSKTSVDTSYGIPGSVHGGRFGPVHAPGRTVGLPAMTRVLSGIQPTGEIHLGNYVGAIRQWTVDQYAHDAFFCVVDLHALTVEIDPAELRAKTLEAATVLLAAGLDPDVCTVFVQSHVSAHAELSWLLECVAAFGELRRMTQFKDKTAKGGEGAARVGLFTYPVLQAADILLYDTDRVPVGSDQRQHLELCRDIAIRFNQRYGQTFVVPEAAIPKVGATVLDLQE